MMAEGTFSCDATVRGYHVYKDIWVATDGEFLQCARETKGIHGTGSRRGNGLI